jgi:hypothetical protein
VTALVLTSCGYRDIGLRHWLLSESGAFDKTGRRLADKHYSRRKVGSPQFMPPGQRFALVSRDGLSVWGWWRPHPSAGITPMNGLDGWTCVIFRRTPGPGALASDLVLDAERAIGALGHGCGPDGMLTYVWDEKVQSENPGYCYKCAGWVVHPTKPRSADNKKTLLWKPFALAGVEPARRSKRRRAA